jgi:tetratricopeptide (TPR) repeat protein
MTSLTTPGSLGFRLEARSLAAVALALSLVAVGIVPSPAYAKSKAKAAKEQKKEQKDPREMEAREAFAAGNYQDALDIYTKLYAEKLHPTFLRNIARCYQNLADPDHAISSFREYLRKAKDIGPEERTEVEGYIKEMEDLQKKNAAAAAPPVAPAQPLPVAVPVAPLAPQPTVMVQQPAPAPIEEPTPFYKKAWFWGVVGGVVVVATVGGLWAGGVFSEKSHNSCGAPYYCGN